ncbi:right-handed parallel beta-helix repeat-containing protein [bacterium]|nr:right-handed parallel beta-helix repeat-containing protein [bacterium]
MRQLRIQKYELRMNIINKYSLILILVLIGFIRIGFAQIHISGSIEGELIDTTYIVDDDLLLDYGNQLTIHAGARLEFLPETGFTIRSLISAEGTESDSIYFVPQDTSAGWDGILVDFGTPLISSFDYCIVSGSIDYGIYADVPAYFSNCVFERNGNTGFWLNTTAGYDSLLVNCSSGYNESHGFYIQGSAPDVSAYNCQSYSNSLAGFYLHNAKITSCKIYENLNRGVYFIHSIVDSCEIYNNHAEGFNGAVEGEYSNLINSLIYGNITNFGATVHMYGGVGESLVDHCTIVNNVSERGAIACGRRLELTVLNCNIINNTSPAAISTDEDNTIVQYCNIFGNSDLPYEGPGFPDTTGRITYRNANDDPCDEYNNIFLDPLFTDYDNLDFTLTENSPCIYAGDPESERDPDGTITDIGSYYFSQVAVAEHGTRTGKGRISNIQIYPNPFNNSFTVRFEGSAILTIYDILGRMIYTGSAERNRTFHPGLEFPATSGMYFLEYTIGGQTGIKPIQYLK